MDDTGWDTQERAFLRIDPTVSQQESYDALDDIKDVVVRLMAVRARTRTMRREPPLRNRICCRRFVFVGHEDTAHGAQRICTALAGAQNYRSAPHIHFMPHAGPENAARERSNLARLTPLSRW